MLTQKSSNNYEFFKKLEQQAELQANLETHKFLPQQTESMAWLVAKYPWQMLSVLSGLTTVLVSWWF